MIALLRKLFARRPQRHYARDWDGTHATCRCGYSNVWDYSLRKHFADMERIGS